MLRSSLQTGQRTIWLTGRPGLVIYHKPHTSPSHLSAQRRSSTAHVRAFQSSPPWRPASVLDEWVMREARPISLRQLMVFGRSLTEARLISSANYVRTELPTRLAHRIRDMQTLPYVVVTNPHISKVYELYCEAFEAFRRVKEIQTLEDNEIFCKKIRQTLTEHLTVIPKLAIGVLECRDLMTADNIDGFMNTVLRSRISRRVIAEQHLALTETFNSPWHFPDAKPQPDMEFVGEVFIRCNAKEVVQRCWDATQALARGAYGPEVVLPELRIRGHLDSTFPYITSHLEYIIGELLRNSMQAVVEHQMEASRQKVPPIEVTICEAAQHVIIRISDQGGGIPREILPHLWSFSKGPRSSQRLENLHHVPKMAATMQEIQLPTNSMSKQSDGIYGFSTNASIPSEQAASPGILEKVHRSSLSTLSSRPPNLRLGMGLPLSRIYAEYWAGSLDLQSLRGYGVDAFFTDFKVRKQE